MQFAIYTFEGSGDSPTISRIISAQELACFIEVMNARHEDRIHGRPYPDPHTWTPEVPVVESDRVLRVVYGEYRPQPGVLEDQARGDAISNLGCTHAVLQGSVVHLLELCDIVLGKTVHHGHSFQIPFAALVDSVVGIPEGQALPVYYRHPEHSEFIDCVFNRPGVFAMRSEVQALGVSRETWQTWVNPQQMHKVGSKSECPHCQCGGH